MSAGEQNRTPRHTDGDLPRRRSGWCRHLRRCPAPPTRRSPSPWRCPWRSACPACPACRTGPWQRRHRSSRTACWCPPRSRPSRGTRTPYPLRGRRTSAASGWSSRGSLWRSESCIRSTVPRSSPWSPSRRQTMAAPTPAYTNCSSGSRFADCAVVPADLNRHPHY